MDLIATGPDRTGRSPGECFLSEKTVKNHVNRIFAKLGVTLAGRGGQLSGWARPGADRRRGGSCSGPAVGPRRWAPGGSATEPGSPRRGARRNGSVVGTATGPLRAIRARRRRRTCLIAVDRGPRPRPGRSTVGNRARQRGEEGQGTLEYVGLAVLIGIIIAAILTKNYDKTITDAIDKVFTKITKGN